MNIRRRASRLGATAAMLASLAAAASWGFEVPLTIESESGMDYVNHPVTMGVPLPEGAVANASELVLLDSSGKPISAQISEVSRWVDGKSVRWVHATWLQSIKAKENAVVRLATGKPASEKTGLTAVEANGRVTVETGYVKFVVAGKNFTGIEAAWFDPTGKNDFRDASRVIGGPGGGSFVIIAPTNSVTLENEHPKVTGPKEACASTNDGDGQVMIEELGAHRVVVKATGRHMAGERRALDYTVRFYAYAGSPVVRVEHVFVSRQGEQAANFHWMAGLNFDIPTTLRGGQATFGTEKDPVSAAAPARILQDTSDSFAVTAGDKTLASGKGKATKPVTTGWMDLTKGDVGLAVGVKWFWQMHPKMLSADEAGLVRVGLYPEGSQPIEVYRGVSRTHYVTLVFHDGKTDSRQLNALFAGEQRPLRAWASPKYYCRDTHCFGYAVENDKSLFLDEDWPRVEKHNKVMLESLKLLLQKRDGHAYGDQPFERDSYGLYAWGDQYHWSWKDFEKSPVHSHEWRQTWEGNYYDYPMSMLLQFLRTGDKTFLESYWANAVHIGDIHTTNWHPSKELIGGCRYNPPRNFVAYDDGRVDTSVEFNHAMSQSVFAHWYLTGDRRSLEHAELLTNCAMNNHEPDRKWQPRGVGNHIACLWNAYELWRDPKYLERMKGMAYSAMGEFKTGKYRSSGHTDGIGNEGIAYYYWTTGDPAAIETFTQGYPGNKTKSQYPNMAFGLALTYRMTGDERFRQWAWDVFSKKETSARMHNPGCQYRGNAFTLFFLSKASEGWKPPAAAGKGEAASPKTGE